MAVATVGLFEPSNDNYHLQKVNLDGVFAMLSTVGLYHEFCNTFLGMCVCLFLSKVFAGNGKNVQTQ